MDISHSPGEEGRCVQTLLSKDHLLITIAYFIAFGPHGPRRPPPPDEGRKVLFLSVAVCFGAFAVFAFTRMFASPIRPRTMTKEWQEATEEYMKVRSMIIAVAACLFTLCVLIHIAGPGNRAHHWLQGHDGPVGLGEEPPSRPEAQRRVNERAKLHIKHTIPIPIPHFLGSNFHMVLSVSDIQQDRKGYEPLLDWPLSY